MQATQIQKSNTTELTPELKNIIKSESILPSTLPMQTHLDARIAVREHELRCYFEAVLTRLRPREYNGDFTTDIRREAQDNMKILQNLLKRSNQDY
jgi:hypothetical protein